MHGMAWQALDTKGLQSTTYARSKHRAHQPQAQICAGFNNDNLARHKPNLHADALPTSNATQLQAPIAKGLPPGH